jgi:microcystin-dependent protein
MFLYRKKEKKIMHKKFKLSFQKGIFQGLGIVVVILFFLGTAWAVTGLVGTYNSFSDGETLTASKLNANFTSIKAALSSFKTALDATTGTISAYGGNTAPTGWLLCDGTAVSQTMYADLFAVIGCNFGCSGGNFNLPDLRGRFLRGRDGGALRDPDSGTRTAMNTGGNTADNVGSVQVDAFKSHTHSIAKANGNTCTGCGNIYTYLDSAQVVDNSNIIQSAGGNETRPVNAYVNWIVKY